MDAARILDELSVAGAMPVEAIRAADADRAAMLPAFLRAMEQFVENGGGPPERRALFWIFHLLGQWREKSAYRPLADFLRRTPNHIQDILGDAMDQTLHRVMAEVFDGDPEPIYGIILDRAADEFVRSRLLETLAMVVIRGELPRQEVARFLRACASDFEAKQERQVWDGWQCAVALLGFVELKALVYRAFRRGHVRTYWLTMRDFEEDLARAVANPGAPWRNETDYAPFVDTIAELAEWEGYGPEDADPSYDPDRYVRAEPLDHGDLMPQPVVNPYRNVGRNDPCPCGSGKKFKKCCLNSSVDSDGLTGDAR